MHCFSSTYKFSQHIANATLGNYGALRKSIKYYYYTFFFFATVSLETLAILNPPSQSSLACSSYRPHSQELHSELWLKYIMSSFLPTIFFCIVFSPAKVLLLLRLGGDNFDDFSPLEYKRLVNKYPLWYGYTNPLHEMLDVSNTVPTKNHTRRNISLLLFDQLMIIIHSKTN
ncbi:unnamed protein product [Mucor circinelloides]